MEENKIKKFAEDNKELLLVGSLTALVTVCSVLGYKAGYKSGYKEKEFEVLRETIVDGLAKALSEPMAE